jgi:hypothetical protein
MTPRERVPRGPGAEEIVARLRGYEREHGRPPSLTEWQRRRLEPSVNTIYRRFGSWPAALAAAAMRSPGSIRTEASSRWGEAETIAALRAHAAANGRAPDRAEWAQATAQHPSALRVRAVFGGWRQALAAADIALTPASRRWSEDAIIALLRADAATHGKPPRSSDWNRAPGRPNPGSVAKVFGSWNAALEASGVGVAKTQGYWTRERILEALGGLERQLGRPPTSAELNLARHPDHPPAVVVRRAFGSWRAAARQLGWQQPPRRQSGAIPVSLREAIREFEELPSRARWQKLAAAREWPTVHALLREYGSWGSVHIAASQLSSRR